ncbi:MULTISPECIES: hypothetical protein [unclassified Streptomyces]|uniref:hypothetical protein n=1 Tax=unclassified Streptomyces TaxID=2593676 RepID=UPI0020353718|nr:MULTISPECIES: hypothetical protein [unclassified Streptomyces]
MLISAGLAQLAAAATPEGRAHAHRTGIGTACTLLTIDLLYAPIGRIRPTYLLDAAMQARWICAWLHADGEKDTG